MWLFDVDRENMMHNLGSNIAPRLLKERSGHSDTPHKIKFYGDDSKHIVSCSENTFLRDNSLINEHISMNFGYKKNLNKKKISELGENIGNTLDFSFSELRERDWPNIITCHSKLATPLIWSKENRSLSQTTCKLESKDSKITTCKASSCGNFGFLGFENGGIVKFNLQSGIVREEVFPTDDLAQASSLSISGIITDQLNKYVITTSLDGTIKVRDFLKLTVLQTIEVEGKGAITHLESQGDLFCVITTESTSNLSLLVYDLSTMKLIRRFTNIHENAVTGVCFSHDSRWVITTSMDKSLKVWDLLTSSLIDWIKFVDIPRSVAYAPTGEYLATTHVGKKGIYLWSSKAFFGNVFIQDVPKRPHYLDLPNITDTDKQKLTHQDFYEAKQKTQAEEEDEKRMESSQIDKAFEELLKDDKELMKTKNSTTCAKISDDPFSKWQSLYYIDNIKQRNKPLDAKAKKQDAPFFLFDLENAIGGNDAGQDLYGVQYFTGKKELDDESKTLTSIIQDSKNLSSLNQTGNVLELKELLQKYHNSKISSSKLLDYFRKISPSAIELEFLSLSDFEFDTNKKIDYIDTFLKFIEETIESRQNVEIIQVLLSNFIKNNFEETMVQKARIESILVKQEEFASKFEDLLLYNMLI
mmetsp:Transcript_39227/g.38816  ORF Transcript_39227/g.38816 Transcript_39227/m.38816 type:complete len:642 (-) Transcript_39227:23-1948(-)